MRLADQEALRYSTNYKAKSPRLIPGVGGKISSAKPLRAEAIASQEEHEERGRLAVRRLTRRRAKRGLWVLFWAFLPEAFYNIKNKIETAVRSTAASRPKGKAMVERSAASRPWCAEGSVSEETDEPRCTCQ
ncbi:hypothetical protein PKOR_01835 [Pontibacter korlensis]|uniref:Uncharacterized protein n=1 Tax=Pontibacter korlensis TaxID=400092 RepID=A0A0E3ZBN4_9BACT|nr:hypothetical protein [Pontibacter korlensis]AKD02109.1 hypothetical protein PKOR_01835 [Pontibacter korlensis]